MKDFTHPYIDTFFHFPEMNSTNLKALDMIKAGQLNGNFLLVADKQKNGIGRNAHFWFSPLGGLWFTLGLFNVPVSSGLTLFTGIILHQVISQVDASVAKALTIKWPNDLYVDNQKAAGILTSYLSHQKYHLIGCGINTNNRFENNDAALNAISLCEYIGRKISNSELLYSFITTFFQQLPAYIENGINLSYYLAHDYLRFKKITILTEFENYTGMYSGITRDGAILIQLDNGFLQPFYAGSISIINPDN
jgi:BirA family biotin operon repressor/biotin-[acetyl-CoA-carboxylase] ligase